MTPMRHLASLLALSAVLSAQGLVPPPAPIENPTTPAKVVLGKILFYEEQLSSDNSTACASCHMPEVAGGDPRAFTAGNVHPGPDATFGTVDDARGSRGIVSCSGNGTLVDDGVFFPKEIVTARKAPAFIGNQWDAQQFWDGRADGKVRDPITNATVIGTGGSLEAQALLPPIAGEMGCSGRNWPVIVAKITGARPMRLASSLTPDIAAALAAHPTYPALFNAAFGTSTITPSLIAFAIAAYERSLVPNQAPIDAFIAGNTAALTPAQVNGLAIFSASNCAFCHTSPTFTSPGFFNIGVRPPAEDMGRAGITGNFADRGKFKTPSLRNAALRGPYFHNGSAATLADVIDFYDRGGDFADNRDSIIVPLNLTNAQKADLHDFLANALLDPRVPARLPPFDRPVLRSEGSPDPAPFGVGSPGSGGFVPQMVAPAPAMIGSDHFGFGVFGGIAGMPAYLLLADAALPPGVFVGGMPLWVDPNASLNVLPLSVNGGPTGIPGQGFASLFVSIPEMPALSGVSLYAQWVLGDPGVPTGMAVSDGLAITFSRP